MFGLRWSLYARQRVAQVVAQLVSKVVTRVVVRVAKNVSKVVAVRNKYVCTVSRCIRCSGGCGRFARDSVLL